MTVNPIRRGEEDSPKADAGILYPVSRNSDGFSPKKSRPGKRFAGEPTFPGCTQTTEKISALYR